MQMELHTISRDGLYDAKAIYLDGTVTVKKGSRINVNFGSRFKPTPTIKAKFDDHTLYDENGILQKDVIFSSLSTAASFVTGRTSNGMIVWKTADGHYVRETLKPKEK